MSQTDTLILEVQMGDIAALDRIAIFIGGRPGSSKEITQEERESGPKRETSDDFLLQCAQLSANLAQTTAVLDPKLAAGDPGSLTFLLLVHG